MPSSLRADCTRCFALCCVAPAFAKSSDFAITKPAGRPCQHLRADFRCGIHTNLRNRGFTGCTVFDCFGAGQKVSQETFGGVDWRDTPSVAEQQFEALGIMRQLHELLYYLTEALAIPAAASIHGELEEARLTTERMSDGTPEMLAGLDLAAHRVVVNTLLTRTSDVVREPHGPNRRGAELVGARLTGARLRNANLRGALLIGADLRRADLRGADVTGADFRGADLRGADLTGALFLTQSQLTAANGDPETLLSPPATRPAHWTAATPLKLI